MDEVKRGSEPMAPPLTPMVNGMWYCLKRLMIDTEEDESLTPSSLKRMSPLRRLPTPPEVPVVNPPVHPPVHPLVYPVIPVDPEVVDPAELVVLPVDPEVEFPVLFPLLQFCPLRGM